VGSFNRRCGASFRKNLRRNSQKLRRGRSSLNRGKSKCGGVRKERAEARGGHRRALLRKWLGQQPRMKVQRKGGFSELWSGKGGCKFSPGAERWSSRPSDGYPRLKVECARDFRKRETGPCRKVKYLQKKKGGEQTKEHRGFGGGNHLTLKKGPRGEYTRFWQTRVCEQTPSFKAGQSTQH